MFVNKIMRKEYNGELYIIYKNKGDQFIGK